MAKAYLYNLTDTWDNAATTFNAIRMSVTDTASAAGSLLMDLQVGGTSRFSVDKTGFMTITGAGTAGFDVASTVRVTGSTGQVRLYNSGAFSWSSTGLPSGAADLILARDAANTLAQRNGTNAQAFRVYNTYTDASNYERFSAFWSSNTLKLLQENAGTGTARTMVIGTAGAAAMYVQTNNNNRWFFETGGRFLAAEDNTYDIGASGATRPRNLFVAGTARSQYFQLTLADGTARSYLQSSTDGVITVLNSAGTDFSRLQFGGTTASFPSLKRNATALETKLADDSAYAPHAMQYLDVTDGVTAPAAATGRARIYVDTADGDLKIIFADGTVKTIVTDT